MEDIIIESSNQSSNVAANVRKVRIRKPRNVMSYVFNWIIKGLFVALLLCIDFLLFAGSGNQAVFGSSYMLQPEIMSIMIGLLVFSLLLMFLFSFSSILQNLVAAVVAAGFVLALLNQFALYDKTSILLPVLSPYLGYGVASMFMGISHWVLAALAGVVTLVVLTVSSKTNVAYFTGILLVVFMGIVVDDYLVKDKKTEFVVEYDNHLDKETANPKKYVYLFLPNATSYVTLGELKNQLGKTDAAQQTQDRLIAFLAKNGFWVYPNAYVKEKNAIANMVEALNNIEEKQVGEHVQKNVEITSLWNFRHVRDEDVFIKNAQLVDVYKNSKYRVNAYQSRGIDFCRKNNEMNVDKCVSKVNAPVDASGLKLSAWDKSKLLLLQWLNSFHFVSDWSTVYGALNEVMSADRMPIIGVSYDALYVVNSFKTLDVLLEDIEKDKGHRVYFVFLDIPSDMYVYDQFCRLKPQSQWLTMENYKWVNNKNVFEKRIAYQEQFSCMIGKLEQFIQQLKEKQLDKNTVVVLQGISGLNDAGNVKSENYIDNFKSENLVLLAIKDPARNNFSINNHICQSKELVRSYLYKQGTCKEFDGTGLSRTSALELQKNLLASMVSQDKVNKALQDFDGWYKNWQNVNNGGMPDVQTEDVQADVPADVDVSLPPAKEEDSTEESTAVEPESVVEEVKVMETPLEEGAEVSVESLSDMAVPAEGEADPLEGLNAAIVSEEPAEAEGIEKAVPAE